MDPCRDDGELLLHAVRVRADGLTEIARELKRIGIRLDARPALRSRDAEDVGNEVQVLDAAHEIVQVRVVRDVGEQLLAGQRLGFDRVPADRDLARIKLQDTDGRLERRRLAGAVVADEAVDLARRDVQAQIIDGLFLTISLGKMLNIEHGVSSRSLRRCVPALLSHFLVHYTPAQCAAATDFSLFKKCVRFAGRIRALSVRECFSCADNHAKKFLRRGHFAARRLYFRFRRGIVRAERPRQKFYGGVCCGDPTAGI